MLLDFINELSLQWIFCDAHGNKKLHGSIEPSQKMYMYFFVCEIVLWVK